MTMSRRLYDALAKYNDLISQAEDIIDTVYNEMSQDVDELGQDDAARVEDLYYDTLALNGQTLELPDPPASVEE